MTIAVHHMDRSPSQPSPNSVNVETCPMFRSISEVKRELKKLVRLAAQDEEDCSTEVYDEICDKAQVLKKYKCRKPQPAAPSKSRSFSDQLDSIPVPDCFQCPISADLMRDPVILASGQTYDRASIQAWLDAGHRTCPKTQEFLPNLTLTPNYLVRTMIEQWCRWQGLQLECPLRNPNPNANEKGSEGMTPQDRAYLSSLVAKLSGERQSQRREAARELRALTRKKSLYRAHLAQEGNAIPALIPLLLSPDLETQEHAVTTLLNLSILDTNKKLIVEEGVLQPILEVLRNGSMPARENAAAALFSLSALEDNKIAIGASGAIPALVELLRDGSRRGKTDAASAIFNLCVSQGNRGKCVRAGVVPVLLKLMKNVEEEGMSMADEALAILAFIAGNEEGAAAIRNAGALPLLIQFIKHSSDRNKENAVVIIFALCSRYSAYYKEVKSAEEGDGYVALLDLSISGTSRARRKAYALLEQMNKHVSV
ncbi:hypothetical protein SUGI_0335550 [Cryptomeria japonica]|uniref:U-box domain-containing protein 14 n=1 Tax=Cryptomeria japonica TaxID=3369 RepID=UPI002408A150|nr:U-box domain-containing protein 14 [Cryptomeria japonica]XP_057824722.1 U-box domain-containing protein 14 [Cryptomeria japonica]XP_057824724.1 U-box domain-containing protein 14 [Cryptomeria japonica]GLJ18794.1 hypothetical protein SUGI_0335550 [Cryptomeria japonica]